jgi:hypothetical protein
MAKEFDFTEEVSGLQVPTLIVAADADMAPPSHYAERARGGALHRVQLPSSTSSRLACSESCD